MGCLRIFYGRLVRVMIRWQLLRLPTWLSVLRSLPLSRMSRLVVGLLRLTLRWLRVMLVMVRSICDVVRFRDGRRSGGRIDLSACGLADLGMV